MKLRYKVDQSECFRAGIDCERSIQILEVNPAELPQDVRAIIADRLDGIDVCEGRFDKERKRIVPKIAPPKGPSDDWENVLLMSRLPGLESLIEAAKKDDARIFSDLTKEEIASLRAA